MPEYDAFGREIGEDPLATLRDATVRDEPVQAVVAEPAAPDAVVAEPEPIRPRFERPRRRPRSGFAALGLVAAAIAMLGVFGSAAVNRIESGLDDIVATEEPAGLGPRSMIRADNLKAALEQMRASGLGRPLTLRVTPSRVDARLVAGNGRLSLVQVTAEQALRTVGARGTSRRAGIPYERIDVSTPERLVRDDGARIRYLRLDRFGWRAYFRDGSVERG